MLIYFNVSNIFQEELFPNSIKKSHVTTAVSTSGNGSGSCLFVFLLLSRVLDMPVPVMFAHNKACVLDMPIPVRFADNKACVLLATASTSSGLSLFILLNFFQFSVGF